MPRGRVAQEQAHVKLNKRNVEALPARDARYVVWDTELRHFGVCVARRDPKGKAETAKTYVAVYRQGGRVRWMTLGQHGSVTADEARKLAELARGRKALGFDPAAEKASDRTAPLVSKLLDSWIAAHVEAKLKPVTAKHYRRAADVLIKPVLGSRRVKTITRADVAHLRSFLSWCEERRYIEHNPARRFKGYREHARERLLTAEELQRLGRALDRAELVEWPWAVAAIRLLLLTGARKSEILGLRWTEVDVGKGTARLPDSKTGAKTLHFGRAALDVLEAVPRRPDNPFVIAGRLNGERLVGIDHIWARIRAEAGLDDLRIHDLRHAFASAAAADGVPLLTLGRMLGHSQPIVTDRYAHLQASPLVAAADRVGNLIAGMMKGNCAGPDEQAERASELSDGMHPGAAV